MRPVSLEPKSRELCPMNLLRREMNLRSSRRLVRKLERSGSLVTVGMEMKMGVVLPLAPLAARALKRAPDLEKLWVRNGAGLHPRKHDLVELARADVADRLGHEPDIVGIVVGGIASHDLTEHSGGGCRGGRHLLEPGFEHVERGAFVVALVERGCGQ